MNPQQYEDPAEGMFDLRRPCPYCGASNERLDAKVCWLCAGPMSSVPVKTHIDRDVRDLILIAGALCLVWFAIGVLVGWALL